MTRCEFYSTIKVINKEERVGLIMTEDKKNIVTDGQDLAETAEKLKAEGVTGVTVVVNTFNYTRYKESNDGKELQPVIDGINRAVGQKLDITLHVGLK